MGNGRQLALFVSGNEFLGSGLSLWGAVLVSQFSRETVGLLEPRECRAPRRWVRLHMLGAHMKAVLTSEPQPPSGARNVVCGSQARAGPLFSDGPGG